MVVVTLAPLPVPVRVTVGVAKVQVASAGSPEQARVTGPAKPWTEETVTR